VAGAEYDELRIPEHRCTRGSTHRRRVGSWGPDLTSIPRRHMTNGDPNPGPDLVGQSAERDRLAHILSVRFAAHVDAAAAAVQAAERELAEASEMLERALREAADARYRSDPLVFMRASVSEEVEALGRKTTAKKARAAYRHLVDRAVELADGEVQGFQADLASAERARREGVEARTEAERDARERLEAAQVMQARVLEAQQRAMDGLGLLVQKLAAEAEDA
jgi:hypothetical protein